MTKITAITVSEVRDSRGKPTIAVTVHAGDVSGTFSVPSGASTGAAEALELRDADGHMTEAIRHVTEIIAPALVGTDAEDQALIDHTMLALDGTENKSKLGGNAMIGVSIAAAKAAAAAKGVPTFAHLRTLADIRPSREIPYLYANYINGGKHAVTPLSFQEHLLVPEAETVPEALSMLEALERTLQSAIVATYGEEAGGAIGDEGGYVIPETDPEAPFRLLCEAVRAAGLDGRVHIAIDVAASSFFEDGVYTVGGKPYSVDDLRALYARLLSTYPILSIEDPFAEDAFTDFARLQAESSVRVVGDDLTVTNVKRLRTAIAARSIRAIIIKPNQIGTLTETFETMRLAREHDIDCIVSHRSGETSDDFVADLAYAFGAFGLKAGALRKPERRAKYDRLVAITSLT